MKYRNTLVNLSKNAFKASLILFIIASGIMIYVAIDADPSANFSDIQSGQTIYTYPTYRETGERFQLYVGITDGHRGDYEGEYYEPHNVDVLHIVIFKSLTSDFQNSEILNEFTSDGIYREIESLEDAYYRIGITNLSDSKVSVVTGDAQLNVGLLVAVVVAAIMFAISATLFSIAISMTLTGLIFFGIGYPIYKIVQMEREKQKPGQIYYPQGYGPQQSRQNQSQ